MKSEFEPHVVTRREHTRWCARALVFAVGAPATLAAIYYSPFEALASASVVPGVLLYIAALPLLFKSFRVGRRSYLDGEPMQKWGLHDIWR